MLKLLGSVYIFALLKVISKGSEKSLKFWNLWNWWTFNEKNIYFRGEFLCGNQYNIRLKGMKKTVFYNNVKSWSSKKKPRKQQTILQGTGH